MLILPPSELAARLDSRVFRREVLRSLPPLEGVEDGARPMARRGFLRAASLGLAAFGAAPVWAAGPRQVAAEPLIFAPDNPAEPAAQAATASPQAAPSLVQQEQLQLGQIPADFWSRPRELWLRRQGTNDEVRAVYWKDGQLVADGYWKACAMLRDVRANVMTTMDPTVLDILRGVLGFYQAWQWPYPIVVTSGFRTVATNNLYLKEGAARNSMHLYGKGVDLYIPGIPAKDVAALGVHLQQGGVGFYPDRGFTHLDTGRLRLWRGR